MAHRLSFHNGRAEMAYAGDTPWHGLGARVAGLQTTAAMLEAAGLTWRVELAPVAVDGREVAGYRATVREDSRTVLGIVTDRYQLIQNAAAGDVMDALVTEGGAHVEVAGALDDGRRCWMLAHIPGDFEVTRGDVVKPYMLLAWGHDGKHGLAGKLTPIRVVCDNTLTAAGFGDGQRWSQTADVYVRHTASARLQIEEARKALGLLKKQTEQTADVYRALAAYRITEEQARAYVSDVFPYPAEVARMLTEGARMIDAAELERLTSTRERIDGQRVRVLGLMEHGKGAELARGTAWGAYNAATEWADHVYPVLQSGEVSQTRQTSVLFGAYADTKARALRSAVALAGLS